jgi:hypothetical protein
MYQVRDAWWQNKTGPLTTYIGNQIVVWGQSLAFRVGDVVNPQDTCWAFGFANLEQSRVPQWMIHPILNLPGRIFAKVIRWRDELNRRDRSSRISSRRSFSPAGRRTTGPNRRMIHTASTSARATRRRAYSAASQPPAMARAPASTCITPMSRNSV